MRSLYALYLSLSLAIPAIQPRLRLSGTNRLRSAFHGGQRRSHLRNGSGENSPPINPLVSNA
ncbi:MAG: hypothetical protein KZQ66_08840 [Candidatus Thiodiazotropha sp. (ex Lucinoma aequizonata)]|nr:hypothetical protein [Candidatus Thiodiazotropha sp. (ex Lucinoma aequizonata)]MCU7894488.1 hypothetical protein [Candidatus Thiodiazotropha sp. (ex Lucinoma aequizonata)]MCU7897776.1 hypothetical protein [Candidatus Thiodiazotropha sp. (ex Lucinoma aequizonata)]MCU7902084.1 hypothetical protein [Candidatus Thiodiazotropha sp. (ex Lucinoma aequizonata)]MCU7909157.1 hypothetical protein [Candidatus Thiodiazotropha sp. (ex Lucinoma aequizonata)]